MNVFGERQNVETYIPMVIKKVRDKKYAVHADIDKKNEFKTLYSCKGCC